MALSEKEKEWLERRKNLCNRCGFQKRCSWKSKNIPCEKWGLFQIKAWGTKSGDVEHKFRDAAEFEARVQKWLMYQYEKAYQCKEVSDGFLPDRGTMLMFARLAVEAEMDRKS